MCLLNLPPEDNDDDFVQEEQIINLEVNMDQPPLPPQMGMLPTAPPHINLQANASIINAMRGEFPPCVLDINTVMEVLQSYYVLNDGHVWHCTTCQAILDNPFFLFRFNHLIGIEDLIYQPNCPRCGNQFSIVRPFQTCGSCAQVFIANRSNIMDGVIYNVGSTYVGPPLQRYQPTTIQIVIGRNKFFFPFSLGGL